MLQRLQKKDQPNTVIHDGSHLADVTDDVNARGIIILGILFNIFHAGEKGLIKIRFPSRPAIQDGFLKLISGDHLLHIDAHGISH
jgi:hypothetical protein